MKKIIVYTTQFCGFCDSAKRLLDQKGLKYESIDITNDHELRQKLSEENSWRTVPMIFIDDKFIGGFTELVALDSKGEL